MADIPAGLSVAVKDVVFQRRVYARWDLPPAHYAYSFIYTDKYLVVASDGKRLAASYIWFGSLFDWKYQSPYFVTPPPHPQYLDHNGQQTGFHTLHPDLASSAATNWYFIIGWQNPLAEMLHNALNIIWLFYTYVRLIPRNSKL
jgi:hypothetical protein